MNGKNKDLQKDFFGRPKVVEKYNSIKKEIKEILNNQNNSKIQEFKIGIGCKRGKHRSVAIVEKLADELNNELDNIKLEILHLHIDQQPEKKKGNRKHNVKGVNFLNE